MASILKPKCNFLHRYIRCLLPLETVDVEVKVKVGVITQPLPSTPNLPMNPIPLAVPTSAVATSSATTQTLEVKSPVTSIPVTVYNFAQGKLRGIPYPTGRPQVEENPSTPAAMHPHKCINLKL